MPTTTSSDDTEATQFLDNPAQLHNSARDTMDLAKAKMAIFFNLKHTLPTFNERVYIRLAKNGQGYEVPSSSKFSPLALGPFQTKHKVSNLAYKLELPANMKIHPAISIIHLEQHAPDKSNRRIPAKPDPVMVDGHEEFKIDKILDQHTDKCLVRWGDLNEETLEPVRNLMELIPGFWQTWPYLMVSVLTSECHYSRHFHTSH